MPRNLVGWVLLVPMLLNGLWIVCNDVPSTAAAAATAQGLPDEAADCVQMCPMKHQGNAGEMCLILPGAAKQSITIVDFGAAILTPEVQLQPLVSLETIGVALPASYSSPVLANHTPPPKSVIHF